MKNYAQIYSLFLLICCLFAGVSAQKKPVKKTSPATSQVVEKADAETEKAAFDAAQSTSDLGERIAKLLDFVKRFPNSELKNRALESVAVTRAAFGDLLLESGETAKGLEQFKRAAADAPANMSDKLFVEVVSRIPLNLFLRGERAAALEIAKTVEAKAGQNADRLLAAAQFYLIIEDGDNARRIAERAAAAKPDSANAQLALGLANRLGFRLEAASQAFSRAVELDGKSIQAQRGLADALRGLGQNEDAIKIYRAILIDNAGDDAARTGLALALLGAGNRAEAETEMSAALSANPRNYVLLAGAAYWFAANKEGAKAVEYGQRAVAAEPRYTWANIALARGLLLEKRPLEAERALLAARQYGNFPTLDYELANARFAAGFYEDAANDLRKTFALKNGVLETKLAGRTVEQSNNFIELLALERRAAILQPISADSEETAAQLKKLLALSNALNAETKDEAAVSAAVKEFVAGDDAARTHRQLYAANRLLREKIDLPQALELTRAATAGVEAAMDVPSAEAAVLAEELYEPRRLAAARNGTIDIPRIDRAVLDKVLRGRIEEIAGWTLYNQDKPDEAVVRLKRAIFVLPIESSFWRSSLWRLGAAYERIGKSSEALEAYIRSYRGAPPDELKLAAIQGLHTKVFGSLDGLNEKLDPNNQPTTAALNTQRTVLSRQTPPAAAPKNPLPNIIGEIIPPKTQTAKAAAETAPTPETKLTPDIKPEITPQPTPEVKTQIAAPENKPVAAPTQTAETKIAIAEPKSADGAANSTAAANESEAATQPNPKPEKNISLPRPRVLVVDNLKNTVTEIAPSGESKSEPLNGGAAVQNNSPEIAAPTLPENAAENTAENTEAQNENTASPRTRKRLVACSIWSNQEAVSIINDGGIVSLLIGEEGTETMGNLTAVSSSPADIEVKLDGEIGKTERRMLFIVRSISAKKGSYNIVVESSCGKKTIPVTVR